MKKLDRGNNVSNTTSLIRSLTLQLLQTDKAFTVNRRKQTLTQNVLVTLMLKPQNYIVAATLPRRWMESSTHNIP